MYKIIIASLIFLLQANFNAGQGSGLVPQSMTAAELWNPFSWLYPYNIASAEAWAKYFRDAQEATNKLYEHMHLIYSSGKSNLPQPGKPSNPSKPPNQEKEDAGDNQKNPQDKPEEKPQNGEGAEKEGAEKKD